MYEAHCAVCHGVNGDGRGEAASRFATPPRDFTKGVYKFRSTGSGRLPTNEDLIRTISRGVPGTAMVAQGHLTPAEIQLIVNYIKSLSLKFTVGSVPKPLALPPPPGKNPETIAQGRKVYEKGGCIECHGKRGQGDGPSAGRLSVKPADLTRRPLKSGPAPRDVARSILTGLDGTSMPSYHLTLSGEEIWKLAYYIDSLGGPPQLTGDERLGQEIVRQLERRHPR